jgi:hypothetical protein
MPAPKDPFNYSQAYRFREATNRAVSRLKKWAYRQLATTGIPLRWHVQDDRIRLCQGRHRTRVVLTGSAIGAVRAEWAGALAAHRDQVLAANRFRRAVNSRGTVVDVAKIKAGSSLLDKLRRQLAANRVPRPSRTPRDPLSAVPAVRRHRPRRGDSCASGARRGARSGLRDRCPCQRAARIITVSVGDAGDG